MRVNDNFVRKAQRATVQGDMKAGYLHPTRAREKNDALKTYNFNDLRRTVQDPQIPASPLHSAGSLSRSG